MKIVILVLIVLVGISSKVNAETWPKRILLSNDNCVSDIKLKKLAQKLSKQYEVHVIAPENDMSGTTHLLRMVGQILEVIGFSQAP